MITINQILKFPLEEFTCLKTESLAQGVSFLEQLEVEWISGEQCFQKKGEGLFALRKDYKMIGVGSIQWSPTAPPTAGIVLLNNCYILTKERKKGYGTLLFKHLLQHAKAHFELVELTEDCPLTERLGQLSVINHFP